MRGGGGGKRDDGHAPSISSNNNGHCISLAWRRGIEPTAEGKGAGAREIIKRERKAGGRRWVESDER